VNRWYAIAAFWLVLVVAVFVWEHLREQAAVGNGYVAKEVCSCVFVGGRGFEACRADVPASMERVRAELGADRVRAFVPGLGERIARHEPPFGCVLY
jgi:hypothetical protein